MPRSGPKTQLTGFTGASWQKLYQPRVAAITRGADTVEPSGFRPYSKLCLHKQQGGTYGSDRLPVLLNVWVIWRTNKVVKPMPATEGVRHAAHVEAS
jgi:hypothetical protein